MGPSSILRGIVSLLSRTVQLVRRMRLDIAIVLVNNYFGQLNYYVGQIKHLSKQLQLIVLIIRIRVVLRDVHDVTCPLRNL